MYSQNTCFYNPSFIVCHIDSENHSENDDTRKLDLQRFIDVLLLKYFIDKRIFMPNVKYLKHFKLFYQNFSLFAQKLIGRPRPSTGFNFKNSNMMNESHENEIIFVAKIFSIYI